jgi:hypothetical protein
MEKSDHHRALAKAIEIIGGVDKLAAWLGVSPRNVNLWLNRSPRIPTQIFLRVVDILMDEPQENYRFSSRRSVSRTTIE